MKRIKHGPVEDLRSRVQEVASECTPGIGAMVRSEDTGREKRSTLNSSGSGSGSEGNSKFLILNNGENRENRM